jgi:hypothetical protein
MTMRDKISEIITDTISGGRDQRIAAVAILAALPDYDAQQARIKELEEALERIAKASDYYGKEASDHDEFALAYAHQSTNRLARAVLKGDANEV